MYPSLNILRESISGQQRLPLRPLFTSAHLQRHIVLVILETLLLLTLVRIHALLEAGVVGLARRKLSKILQPVRTYRAVYGESRSVKSYENLVQRSVCLFDSDWLAVPGTLWSIASTFGLLSTCCSAVIGGLCSLGTVHCLLRSSRRVSSAKQNASDRTALGVGGQFRSRLVDKSKVGLLDIRYMIRFDIGYLNAAIWQQEA